VRRPGARVDRLGAGAVWISRLQPAWGLSPAVHGRAIVETGARLIGAACRARRVGHDRLPRRWRGRARQRLAPTGMGGASPVAAFVPATVGPSPVCRGQAVPDPPARQGREGIAGAVGNRVSRIANAHDGAPRGCRARRWAAQAAAPHRAGQRPPWPRSPTPRPRRTAGWRRDPRPPKPSTTLARCTGRRRDGRRALPAGRPVARERRGRRYDRTRSILTARTLSAIQGVDTDGNASAWTVGRARCREYGR
jgi:hypothetical protein